MDRKGISRRELLKYSIGGLLGAASGGGLGWLLTQRFRDRFQVRAVHQLMGTYVSVMVLADNPAHARLTVDDAFRSMRDTAACLSRFNADGPVGCLNRTGKIAAPPEDLYNVLVRARHYSEISAGSFDVTVLPVLRYYYQLPRPVDPRFLDRTAIYARDALVSYQDLIFDRAHVELRRPGMGVTLDGIAKGYVVDAGMTALRQAGHLDALIDAGGDVHVSSGHDPDHYWTVGIADPHDTKRMCATVRLRNGAVATSGNYEIFFSPDRRLFHIINPHTGYSPDQYSSVTVLADHSVDSDALGVTLFSLERERIRELLVREGRQCFIVSWDGKERWRTEGFPMVTGRATVL